MNSTQIKKALGLTGLWKLVGMSSHSPEYLVWVTVAKITHPTKGTRYACTTPKRANFQIHEVNKETYRDAMFASLTER